MINFTTEQLEKIAQDAQLEKQLLFKVCGHRMNNKITIGDVRLILEHAEEILGLTTKDIIRYAVADYMRSEGCSCCRDIDAHAEHTKRLAELLDVPMYDDESGYNFHQFSSSYNVEE